MQQFLHSLPGSGQAPWEQSSYSFVKHPTKISEQLIWVNWNPNPQVTLHSPTFGPRGPNRPNGPPGPGPNGPPGPGPNGPPGPGPNGSLVGSVNDPIINIKLIISRAHKSLKSTKVKNFFHGFIIPSNVHQPSGALEPV